MNSSRASGASSRSRLAAWSRLASLSVRRLRTHGLRDLLAKGNQPALDASLVSAIDLMMMARCIALSRQSAERHEHPFACVIAKDGLVVVEATSRVARDRDVTRHAELLAISAAQRQLRRTRLAGCTLYSTVEPCPMCAFPIRETRISRVVYALPSPVMGGHSRWNVLGDPVLSGKMPEVFGRAPEVIAGLLRHEAEQVRSRAAGMGCAHDAPAHVPAASEFDAEDAVPALHPAEPAEPDPDNREPV